MSALIPDPSSVEARLLAGWTRVEDARGTRGVVYTARPDRDRGQIKGTVYRIYADGETISEIWRGKQSARVNFMRPPRLPRGAPPLGDPRADWPGGGVSILDRSGASWVNDGNLDTLRALLSGVANSPGTSARRPRRSAPLQRSRRDEWLRDELILALDLYRQLGPNPPRRVRAELSTLLRSIPIEVELSDDPSFRSVASVTRKLGNFLALDPELPGGLTHAGEADRAVWRDFADAPDRLHATAEAIRASIDLVPSDDSAIEPEIAEALEGRLLTRLHVSRERNRRLVESKKRAVLRATESLACEACGFDFESRYGERGGGFIECHHIRPVSLLIGETRTSLDDLALVCSNCHRMIHRAQPWLTLDQLRALLT
jgi:5-methylcytosine-specific restriction protein A